MTMDTTKKRKGATNRGRIVGVVRANGGWLFVVQSFSTHAEEVPILCQLMAAEQLKGQVRKKAERWTRYLNGTGEARAAA
jgi:hypothetical protein